ncbi:lycopene cyclase family protein [Tomitella fengzijianii]|uniref:lycopene cyclase family protein n=1 Tax=Tomitella fengzijianii TaxID=2597660 RepID=UPI001E53BB78|nr:lycopene cyclase family protein [Tomitella fengzijianii]
MTTVPPAGGAVDLAVVGLGPAGRALAHRAAARGLDVVGIDPRPHRGWHATYAAWVDEVPDWLGDDVWRARLPRPRVHGVQERALDRAYGIFDNAALRRRLDLSGVRVITGSAEIPALSAVTLRDGRRIDARRVVDARGVRPDPELAEQTAFGVVVPADVAAPALDGGEAWFMDWRPDNAAIDGAPPSFLYAMPLGEGTVLLEETCLVGRPGLPLRELRRRLVARLSARGVEIPADVAVERVRFPVQAPRRGGSAPAFGARAGLMHPGTGYSVAASLSAADTVVDSLVRDRDPSRALWPWQARTVRHLRDVGLSALLSLDPAATARFFDAFFALPAARQGAFLSGRADVAGTAAAMWSLFRAVDPATRRTLARAGLRGNA